jgi:hypothetical protein
MALLSPWATSRRDTRRRLHAVAEFVDVLSRLRATIGTHAPSGIKPSLGHQGQGLLRLLRIELLVMA